MNETQQTIVEILLSFSEEPANLQSLDLNQPVFGSAGVISDSLTILDALASIEKAFDIRVPDEDLTEELFSSVRILSDYVQGRKALGK